jgi:hypothetical protein
LPKGSDGNPLAHARVFAAAVKYQVSPATHTMKRYSWWS